MDSGIEWLLKQTRALMDENRTRCLSHLPEDYYPETVAEAVQVLEAIERHGDALAFRRAATLRQWIERVSGAPPADS